MFKQHWQQLHVQNIYSWGIRLSQRKLYYAVHSLHAKETNTHKEQPRYKVGIDT